MIPEAIQNRNPSPLRYPGGKYKLSRLVKLLMDKSGDERTVYIEPFAGGAGVALDLLLKDVAQEIVINDSDRAIAAFWKFAVTRSEDFVDRIYCTPVTLAEWRHQREVYFASTKITFDYAFAAFFLNRTNHSGILSAGPIGGLEQGAWKLDVRYNKEDLISKIRAIGEHRTRIHVYNRDVLSFLVRQLPKFYSRAFIYFDPPYYRRGKVLYKNFFGPRDHKRLANEIRQIGQCPWIVSYDAAEQIKQIYEGVPFREFALSYSLANNGSGREIMFFSDGLQLTDGDIRLLGMERQFGLGRSARSSSMGHS